MADSSLTTPVSPAAATPPPLPVRADSACKSAKPARPPLALPDETPDSPKHGLLRTYSGSTAMAYVTSFLFHMALVAVFALCVFADQIPMPELPIDGGNKVGLPVEMENLPDISLSNQGGKVQNVATTAVARLIARPTENGKLPTDLTDSVDLTPSKTTGDGKATGTGKDDEGKGSIPYGNLKLSHRSVRKGSFLVRWYPDKPVPQKPYYLYVEITLPEKYAKQYPVKDLTGEIHGDESKHNKDQYDYVQKIPWDPRLARLGGPGYRQHTFALDHRRRRWYWINPKNRRQQHIRVVDGKVVILLKVPGAETKRIKDTIKIRSKLLKEKQTLEIVF